MTRLKASIAFRTRLSEKLMDLGNYVAVGLVIGQFVTTGGFSETILKSGVAGTIALYLAAYLISS